MADVIVTTKDGFTEHPYSRLQFEGDHLVVRSPERDTIYARGYWLKAEEVDE